MNSSYRAWLLLAIIYTLMSIAIFSLFNVLIATTFFLTGITAPFIIIFVYWLTDGYFMA